MWRQSGLRERLTGVKDAKGKKIQKEGILPKLLDFVREDDFQKLDTFVIRVLTFDYNIFGIIEDVFDIGFDFVRREESKK